MVAEQAYVSLHPEPVALAPDVYHMAVVQQPVQHRREDYSLAEETAQLAESVECYRWTRQSRSRWHN